MKEIFVRPKKHKRVLKRNGQIIPKTGTTIIVNPYYKRLLNDGDLIACKKPKTTPTEPKTNQE